MSIKDAEKKAAKRWSKFDNETKWKIISGVLFVLLILSWYF